MHPISLACLLALLLAGCGDGSGGTLDTDLGAALGTWQILDLDSGMVTSSATPPVVAAHRERTLAFRRLGSSQRFIALTELTQAQWLRLGGTRPWQASEFAGMTAAPVEGSTLPAWDLDREAVDLALAGWNGRRPETVLVLPDATDWNQAAAASETAWKQPTEAATTSGAAVFAQSRAVLPPVASDLPDALGLHDVRGSVWELTTETVNGMAVVRGGSWHDRPDLAGGATRALVAADAAHPLVGARLVLVLP